MPAVILLRCGAMGDLNDLQPLTGLSKKRRPGNKAHWLWIAAGLCVAGVAALLFTPIPGKIKRGLNELIHGPAPKPPRTVDEADLKRQIESRLRAEMEGELEDQVDQIKREAQEEIKRAEQSSLPSESGPTATGGANVRKLSTGITFKSEVKLDKGTLASRERVDPESYTAEYKLTVRLPEPAKTLDELKTSNPTLGDMLPGLAELLPKATVSRWYFELYKNKTDRVKREATSLTDLVTKHNFFDCETILNLRSAGGRRAFLLQADMDVVSDGSDGDRMATMPDSVVHSANYQPFTSYAWTKRTQTPNPIIAGWEKRIAETEKEAADRATTAARKSWLKERAAFLKRGVSDMKSRSFLIADYDPFIVIPVNILNSSGDPFAPRVGDYVVVIHGKRLFPAIVGDGGPTYKTGEASLRIAKQISAAANPYNRPESDLKVTYLVFPGSREEKHEPPDYTKWRDKCLALLGEIGGLGAGYELFHWDNLLPDPTQAAPSGKLPLSVQQTLPGVPTSQIQTTPPPVQPAQAPKH
jgi:hypothetical protein